MQMKRLLFIDDEPLKLDYARAAANTLEVPHDYLRPQRESYDEVLNSLNAKTGDLVVCLDLGFRSGQQDIWPTVLTQLRKLSQRIPALRIEDTGAISFTTDEGVESFPQELVDGISLIETILASVENKRCLIVAVSSKGNRAGLAPLFRIINRHATEHNLGVRCEADEAGRDFANETRAIGILRTIPARWQANFPDFCSDLWVNNCIAAWIDCYRSKKKNLLNADAIPDDFCQHDPIEETASEYSQLICAMFGLSTEVSTILEGDTNGRKAVLMLSKEPSKAINADPWFSAWSTYSSPKPGWKRIAKESLAPILQSVCAMKVDVNLTEGANEVRLPVCPALPFLAALHMLFQALRGQVGGSILDDSALVTVGGTEGAYRLSVPLKKDTNERFGLAKTWIEKLKDGGTRITSHGVCAALWQASLARVSVSPSATDDDIEKALLGVFEGPGQPVIAVGFAPHFVNLFWS